MTPTEQALKLMEDMVQCGEAKNTGDAYILLNKRYPLLMEQTENERKHQGTLVQKARAQVLKVVDPPGVKKNADGSLAPWEQQVEFWKRYPAERAKYDTHARLR